MLMPLPINITGTTSLRLPLFVSGPFLSWFHFSLHLACTLRPILLATLLQGLQILEHLSFQDTCPGTPISRNNPSSAVLESQLLDSLGKGAGTLSPPPISYLPCIPSLPSSLPCTAISPLNLQELFVLRQTLAKLPGLFWNTWPQVILLPQPPQQLELETCVGTYGQKWIPKWKLPLGWSQSLLELCTVLTQQIPFQSGGAGLCICLLPPSTISDRVAPSQWHCPLPTQWAHLESLGCELCWVTFLLKGAVWLWLPLLTLSPPPTLNASSTPLQSVLTAQTPVALHHFCATQTSSEPNLLPVLFWYSLLFLPGNLMQLNE